VENLGFHTVRLSVVLRQSSRLDLQVELSLPAIANAAQPPDRVDPASPIAAELSGQAALGLGGRCLEAPRKKAGCNVTYFIDIVVWEPSSHIPVPDFVLPYTSHSTNGELVCGVTW